ncbi:MAG: hydroxypyruvate isomerase [Alphaproteobacteria bacterium]|nr:hydroxypyruvate isomerase [Alphaproteobacteria bacterium]
MPKFSANLSMLFDHLEFLARFEAAAAAGFRAVEYASPYDHDRQELRRRLDRHGLRQILINAPPGDLAAGDRGLAIFADRRDEFIDGIHRAIDYARTLACPRIHVMAGVLPPGQTIADIAETYEANLRQAAAAAGPHGIDCLIEPLNVRDVPGYALTSTAHARRVIDRVGAANVGLQLDLYHRQIMRGGLAEAIREYLPITRHIQIAGVPGRHEPDVGEINYPYLFDLLDELGYDGWVGCEYHPMADTAAGLGWARAHGLGRS